MNDSQLTTFWNMSRRPVVIGAIGSAIIVLLLAITTIRGLTGGLSSDQQLVPYVVKQVDLPILVTERGNLEAQLETTLRCEVENNAVDRSGNYGTQIIFIVPNGSAVKEGELLVEMDSAAIRDRLDQQVLDKERAVSTRIQAEAKFANQKLQNETAEAQAALQVELARLELEMYMDKANGTFQLSLEEIDRAIDDCNNEILAARASLELQKWEQAGIEELYKLGYRGQNDLNQSQLSLLQAEDKLSSSVNKLSTCLANRRKLENYEREMQVLTLQGNQSTAERGLLQVRNDNESLLAQAEAAYEEAKKAEQKETERLTKLEDQLLKCKVYAPHDGMVVYARDSDRRSSNPEIAEGVTVRQRQRIITLPDLSQMQVKTQVHEAVLDQIRAGLPTMVRIDAFPDRVYTGLVDHVAVVPSSTSFYSSGVKTYQMTVKIQDQVEDLKPGMTAVVEVHVDRLRDVLSVPVQAVVQRGRENWCYVKIGRRTEQRMLKLGRSNDKFVHIQDGLDEGDILVLNPMAIFDESKQTDISPDGDVPEMPDIQVETVAENPDGSGTNGQRGGGAEGRGKAGVRNAKAGAGQGPRTSRIRPANAAASAGRPRAGTQAGGGD